MQTKSFQPIQLRGKRPAEPKTFKEFETLLETVEGLKYDGDGVLSLRYSGK